MAEANIEVLRQADGSFELVVYDGGDEAAELFEAEELQGGGYTWQAVLEVLARKSFDVLEHEQDPPDPILLVSRGGIRHRLSFGAEGDVAHVRADDRGLLQELADKARAAASDRPQLEALLRDANPELLE